MSLTMQGVKKTQEEYDKEWLERRRLRRELIASTPPPRQDSQMEKLASEILEYWNSKKIIVHRKYSDRTPRVLARVIKEFSKEEILQAIDNYVTVLQDESYYFKTRWKLEEFLQHTNTLPDFIENGSKWLSYLAAITHKAKPKKENPIPISELEENPFMEDGNSQFIKDNYSMMLKSFRTMPYEEYLQTEHWLHFKTEALKASGYRCKMCNTPDKTLFVHHNNYDNRGRETFNDVIVLCGGCHAKFHGK